MNGIGGELIDARDEEKMIGSVAIQIIKPITEKDIQFIADCLRARLRDIGMFNEEGPVTKRGT